MHQEGSARPRRAGRAGGKPARWTHREGRKGHCVTVYERVPGGLLHGRFQHPITRQLVRVCLQHSDRKAAADWAADQAAKLRRGTAAVPLPAPRMTLARLLADYAVAKSAGLSKARQQSNEQRSELWVRALGAGKHPHDITVAELVRFRDARLAGAIDARGRAVTPATARKPVRLRTVEADAEWLYRVLLWGMNSRDPETRQKRLQDNPLGEDDFTEFWKSVRDPNARRPVVGTERYRAIRAVADQVLMECRWHGKREKVPSYLPEVLDLAHYTGRRISAILGLRWENVLLGKEYGLHGAIEWPADTDKVGKRWVVPMSPEVRAAIDRVRDARPGLGPALLFPKGTDPTQPVSKDVAGAWLKEAECLAGVPKHRGSLWHAYRRGWATSRKDLSVKDVAAAGGWTCPETLMRHYMQADDDTLLQVMTTAREIRERRA